MFFSEIFALFFKSFLDSIYVSLLADRIFSENYGISLAV
jgi:hypothetical protein